MTLGLDSLHDHPALTVWLRRALEDFGDSQIHPAPGIARTFHDIAESLLSAAEGHDEEDADEISPGDCQEGGE